MASTSQDAAGTPKEIIPQLVELPLVSRNPKPPEGWENPQKGFCPFCKEEVWFHSAIFRALSEPRYRGICSLCIKSERDRQSGM